MLIENINTIDRLAPEWDELVTRTHAPPFMSPGWTTAWWRAFGRGDLQVIIARRNGGLAGVLPVGRRARIIASPTNWHTPEYGPVVEDETVATELLLALLRESPSRVSLRFLDSRRVDLDAWQEVAGSRGYRTAWRTIQRSPYLKVEGRWEDYERGLRRSHRKDVRRVRHRLQEAGQLSTTVHDGKEDLDSLLEEGFKIEGSGWKVERGTAIASQSQLVGFYREIAGWAARRGALRLSFLRLDGRPIAFEFGLEENRVYYLLKLGFDVAYAKYSPGKVLNHALLQRAFHEKLTSYEFLGGEARHKTVWSADVREKLEWQTFAPTAAGLLNLAAFEYGRPIAKRIFHKERSASEPDTLAP
jgi:CelD/BcsL family acetyltransferase involved in cellulose biosynthesis